MRDAVERHRMASDLKHHNAIKLTYQGETHSIRGWARKLHIPLTMLQDRICRRGWSVAEALTTPSGTVRHGTRQVTFKGETKTIGEWAKALGLPWQVLYGRLKNGWKIEAAMTTPLNVVLPGPPDPQCLTFQGKTARISVWAKSAGITPRALRNRLKRGWSLERALTAPKTEGH